MLFLAELFKIPSPPTSSPFTIVTLLNEKGIKFTHFDIPMESAQLANISPVHETF